MQSVTSAQSRSATVRTSYRLIRVTRQSNGTTELDIYLQREFKGKIEAKYGGVERSLYYNL